ncbi:hypothetical protein FBU30_000614 [Linnemannia zychae]|nr:hypothetical protein FBU30_000614 [Linnemannia zychae]
MADIQIQVVEETREHISVPEVSTVTSTLIMGEPVLIPEVSEPAPIATAPMDESIPIPAVVATEVKQQSRLSLAFRKISGGCGLCFSPLKGGNSTDYHNFVDTPTDEEEPFYPDEHHGGSSIPVVISEDYKGEHSGGEIAIASSSTESHYLHRSTEEIHEEVKIRDLAISEAVYEEVSTTVVDEQNPIVHEEQQHTILERVPEMEEIQFSTQIINAPATFVEEIVEDVVIDDSKPPIASAAVVETIRPEVETIAAIVSMPLPPVVPKPVSIPTSPTTTRSPFTKRSKSKRSPSSSRTPSSASSPTTSPILERLGRFAKIIRTSDTHSSISSKVESLKISTAPSTPAEETTIIAPGSVVTAEPEQEIASIQIIKNDRNVPVDAIPTPAHTAPLTPVSPLSTEPVTKQLSVTSIRSDATPSLAPQPQQQASNNITTYNSRRNSLAVDTLIANTTASSISAPVVTPGVASSWSHSPTTLHHHDASTANSSAGHSISITGRASTADSSATEAGGSEVGSLNSNDQLSSLAAATPIVASGKEGEIKTNRKKSVVKKLGKFINTMNINTRKNSMDKDNSHSAKRDKHEKRLSRQGSLPLTSPMEAEENFGF